MECKQKFYHNLLQFIIPNVIFNFSVWAVTVHVDESPACQSNIKPQGLIGPNNCGFEPDELHMTCGVKYHGNQPPIMQWKEVGSNSPIAEGITHNASSDRAIYYLKMEVNSAMHGSSYQCVTTRSTTSQYGCTSDVVSVRDCECVHLQQHFNSE